MICHFIWYSLIQRSNSDKPSGGGGKKLIKKKYLEDKEINLGEERLFCQKVGVDSQISGGRRNPLHASPSRNSNSGLLRKGQWRGWGKKFTKTKLGDNLKKVVDLTIFFVKT